MRVMGIGRRWTTAGSLAVAATTVFAAVALVAVDGRSSAGGSPESPPLTGRPHRDTDRRPSSAPAIATESVGSPGTPAPSADTRRAATTSARAPAPPPPATAEQATFIQVDRWCTAWASPLTPSAERPTCPAASSTASLWLASADADGGRPMFVSADARAAVAALEPAARATALWVGRTLVETASGGPLRVLLSGVSGEITGGCPGCLLTGGVWLTVGVDVRFTDGKGDTVNRQSWCFMEPGRPVPATINVPDDCTGDGLKVPAATPAWVELQLYAHATTMYEPATAARLEVGAATVEVP